jgi:dipeptidyl aminopeptidase/acylaminoacyl peptidase
MPSLLIRLLAAMALGIATASSPARAQAPSVRDIARQHTNPPSLRQVQVSPNGKRAAMIVTAGNGRRVVAVLDLPPQGPPRTVGGFSDANVNNVVWITDDRLAYDAYEPGTLIRNASTMAVDADGGNSRELINWQFDEAAGSAGSRMRTRMLPYGWYLAGSPQDGSADVFVEQRITQATGDFVQSRTSRLNTLTGELKALSLGVPDRVVAQAIDGQGRIRVVLTRQNGRAQLQHLQADNSWQVIEDHEELSDDILVPLHIESDGTLIVSTRRGHDTTGLHAYDLAKRKLDPEALVRLQRFDIDADIEFDRRAGRVIGVHIVTDRPQSVWFSERLAAIQKAVDASLPAGRFNRIHCGHCESTRWYAIESASDRHAGEWLLYDHQQRAFHRLGAGRPWLDEASQGSRSFHRVNARDGLPLPLVMTHPRGRDKPEALPAVLLVHGGPWSRGGDLRWSEEAQFFARRGWRVLEPEFRGSTGFGSRHLRAGWKQWGQAMQDDLADAVQWAAKEGWVDARKVCIVGSSYGGYAALMGPVRHPELFSCAASHAGVTDLQLMFSSNRSDLTDQSRRFTMPQLVGDPVADTEMLRQHSPVNRVAEIKVPLLMAHGLLDQRVPKDHANRFESAARRAGVALERVDYGEEGHGFLLSENHADWLVRLDGFIAKAIGRAP